MKKLLEKFYGFFLVSTGIVVFTGTVFSSLCCYRGAELYYADLKNFKGALSSALGGNYKETKENWVESEVLEITQEQLYDVATLNPEVRKKLLKELKKLED